MGKATFALTLITCLTLGVSAFADALDLPKGMRLSHKGGVEAVAFQPTDHWLVTAGSDGTGCLWDLQAEDPAAACRFVLRGHTN